MSTGHCPGSNMAFWRKSRFFQPSENSYFQPRPFSKMHHHPTYRLGQLFPSHRISHETLIKIWKYQPFLTIVFSRNVWRTSFSRSLWPGLLLCSCSAPYCSPAPPVGVSLLPVKAGQRRGRGWRGNPGVLFRDRYVRWHKTETTDQENCQDLGGSTHAIWDKKGLVD